MLTSNNPVVIARMVRGQVVHMLRESLLELSCGTLECFSAGNDAEGYTITLTCKSGDVPSNQQVDWARAVLQTIDYLF